MPLFETNEVQLRFSHIVVGGGGGGVVRVHVINMSCYLIYIFDKK